MEITLVGFGTELGLIAPGRVQAVSSLADVLPSLEARAAAAAAAPPRGHGLGADRADAWPAPGPLGAALSDHGRAARPGRSWIASGRWPGGYRTGAG